MELARLLLLFVLCIALLACSKDNNPSDSNNTDNDTSKDKTSLLRFTLNGPGVTNRTYEMSNIFYSANYIYQEEDDHSIGSLIGADMNMTTAFPGKSTGTYAFSENSFVALSVNTDDETQLSMFSESGTLVISEANAQTGRLKGTFSGAFRSLNQQMYTITNGSFTIQRR